jgi:hypothetical protein
MQTNNIHGEFYIDDIGEIHINIHTPESATFKDLECVFNKLITLIQKMQRNKERCPYYKNV